jgi:hypothetical protein
MSKNEKIKAFIVHLTSLTKRTGLWIESAYLEETGGFIRYNHEKQEYEYFKERK